MKWFGKYMCGLEN